MHEPYKSIGLVFAIVSALTTTILIILHLWIHKLLKHPGQYMLIQCICQLYYDLHWLMITIDNKRSETDIECKVEALLLITTYNLGFMYISVLGLELCFKLKYKASLYNFKRTLFFHSLCIGIVLVIDFLTIIADKYSITPLNTCSIDEGPAVLLEFCVSIISLVIMVFSVIYLIVHKKSNYSKVISNFTLVIIFILLTWALPSFIPSFDTIQNTSYFTITGYYLGTLSGTLVGLSRIINHKIYREVYKRMLGKTERIAYIKKRIQQNFTNNLAMQDLTEAFNSMMILESSSINFYGELYDNITARNIAEILFVLSMHFNFTIPNLVAHEVKDKTYKSVYSCNSIYSSIDKTQSNFRQNSQDIILYEYRPRLFQRLRNAMGHTNQLIFLSTKDSEVLEDLSKNVIANDTNNSFIFFTKDNKYAIKSISRDEREFFLKGLLERYSQRIIECRESKLVRILGVFKLKPSNISFILMENVAEVNEEYLRFDIKGSVVDRFVETHDLFNCAKVLKDVNFINSGIQLALRPEAIEEIIQVLRDDFLVLKETYVMDYSLLLILDKNTGNDKQFYSRYSAGKQIIVSVIDLFQVYNSRKAFERWLKIYIKCVGKKLLSSVSPNEYFERIFQFTQEIFCNTNLKAPNYLIFY